MRKRPIASVRRDKDRLIDPSIVDLSARGASRGPKAPGRPHPWALTWQQGPVALGFRGLAAELIALRVFRFGEQFEPGEPVDDLILLRRDRAEGSRHFSSGCSTAGSNPSCVCWARRRGRSPGQWEQLSLAEEVRILLQQDFEAWFRDLDWYEQMRIPHRRGYLLHGLRQQQRFRLSRNADQPRADCLRPAVLG